ncbi:MAG: zf-HC2 domain-containing protein [Actinomycetota bacterium]
MKEHPEELLAAFADGDLRERDRVAVEAHLAECEQCSHELVLARRAVTALSGLEEVPAPLGLGTRAIQQAKPVRAWGERLQWAAGIGAAAALIGIFAVIAVRSSTDDARPLDAAGPGAATAESDADGGGEGAPVSAQPFISSDADYDAEALTALVRREAGAQADGGDDGVRATSALSEEEIAIATECVERAGLRAQEGAVLIRVEAARYEGDLAYVVLFERDETVEVWVVDRETCGIRYVASAQREN